MSEAPQQKNETTIALLAIVALGLLIRLLVIPLATTDGSDAVARIWMGWRWASDPVLITHGVWGPLHSYLIGTAMALVPDPVHTPVYLHLFFGVATPLLVYAFAREAFGSARAALLIAVMYTAYPVAIRNSVSARSETPFVAFMVLAMVLLAVARSPRGRALHAGAAGLCLTLAGMLRYEAWMLIPFMSLVLWSKPRLLLIFAVAAMIHPVFWMIGNQVAYGDPFYSVNWAANWERNSMGKAAQPFSLHASAAVRYPLVMLKGMNLLAGFTILGGCLIALWRRDRSRIWLVPAAALLVFLMIGVASGTLVPVLNYTVILGTLLWPFGAMVFRFFEVDQWKRSRFAGVFLAVPGILGLMAMVVGWEGRGSYRASTFTVSPVPRIENQAVALALSGQITQSLRGPTEGVISDFYGWGTTHYVVLLTGRHPDWIFVAPGAPNQPLDEERLDRFLQEHPSGVSIFLKGSRFDLAIRTPQGRAGKKLSFEPVETVQWPPSATLEIMRYQVESR